MRKKRVDRVRVHHERKSHEVKFTVRDDGVRVDHEKRSNGVKLTLTGMRVEQKKSDGVRVHHKKER